MNTTQTSAAGRTGEGSPAAHGTSVAPAADTGRVSTEAALSGGRGFSLPAAPSDQLALDLSPLVTPDYSPRATLQEQFEQFHAANPWVLTALETLTRDYLASGRKRLGIGMLWEVIRYQYGRTISADFKANNNHRSRYVRLMLDRNPDWADVFATRCLTAP